MFKHAFRPFHNKNLRLFFAGEILFFLAYWVSYINMIYLTWSLTQSSFSLGLLGFVVNLPLPLMLPLAGVLADRVNRKRLMCICQILCLLPAGYLAYAEFTNTVHFNMVLLCGFLYGLFFAIANPSAYAMVNDLVTQKQDLHRVLALNSSNVKSTQFLSAAINSLLHLVVGIGGVFVAAVIGHIISLYSYGHIHYERPTPDHAPQHPFLQLKQGFSYVFHFTPYRSLLIEIGVGCTTVGAYLFQLPVFTDKVLHGTMHTLNTLYLVGGIGGLCGGILMSLRHTIHGVARLSSLLVIVMGACFILFAHTTHLSLLLILSFIIDACIVAILGGTTTTFQLIVEKEYMGRVMGILGLMTFGFVAVGSLIMGGLAAHFGAPIVVTASGIICIVMAIFYILRLPHYHRMLQPVYEKLHLPADRQPI